MYAILKHLHLIALSLSFVLFFVRGVLMIRHSSSVNHRSFLIAPHIINAVLIGSGVTLTIVLGLSPSTQSWLMAKLIALIVYIGLGVIAFKHSNPNIRKILWVIALVVFIFIVSIAITKNPLGFYANIF